MADKKTLELWEGYEVEVNEQLLDDFDFLTDLAEAERKHNLAELVSMHFALVGGEKVFQDAREHIESKVGYVSTEEMGKILGVIKTLFPKTGNRAQKRSWQTSK